MGTLASLSIPLPPVSPRHPGDDHATGARLDPSAACFHRWFRPPTARKAQSPTAVSERGASRQTILPAARTGWAVGPRQAQPEGVTRPQTR
jgi:hypothetical protein